MKGLDLKKFKKIHHDDKQAILEHPDGHNITIAIAKLSPDFQKELKSLPLHKANGGMIKRMKEGGPSSPLPENYQAMDQDISPVGPEVFIGDTPHGTHAPETPVQAGPPIPQYPADTPAIPDTNIPLPTNAAPNRDYPDIQTQYSDKPVPDEGNISREDMSPDQIASQSSGQQAGQPSSQSPAAPLGSQLPNPYSEQALNQNDDSVAQDIQNGHIDTQHLFANPSTLGRIGTLFGLLVGSAGAGLAHQPNLLMEMINKELDRDLDAQKASNINAQNWYRLGQNHYLTEAQARHLDASSNLMGIEAQAKQLGLPFVAQQAQAGLKLTEAQARAADANADFANTNTQKNNMLNHVLSKTIPDITNKLPTSAQPQANNVLQNQLIPWAVQQNIKRNAQTAARYQSLLPPGAYGGIGMVGQQPSGGGAIGAAGMVGNTPSAVPGGQNVTPPVPFTSQPLGTFFKEPPVDENQMLDSINKGAFLAKQGFPPGQYISPDAAPGVKEEYTAVGKNRNQLLKYVTAFNALNNKFAGGIFTPGDRNAFLGTVTDIMSHDAIGRFNAQEASRVAASMVPEAGDWNSTAIDKLRNGINTFRLEEENKTPNLSAYHLKKPFPYAPDSIVPEGMQRQDKTGKIKTMTQGKWR